METDRFKINIPIRRNKNANQNKKSICDVFNLSTTNKQSPNKKQIKTRKRVQKQNKPFENLKESVKQIETSDLQKSAIELVSQQLEDSDSTEEQGINKNLSEGVCDDYGDLKYNDYFEASYPPIILNTEETQCTKGFIDDTKSMTEASEYLTKREKESIKNDSNQSDCFLLQLPPHLPYRTEKLSSSDSLGDERCLVSDLSSLSSGLIGEILIYKNGETKLKIGETVLNVRKGKDTNYFEEFVSIDKKCYFEKLGKCDSKLVCSLDVESLLKNMRLN